MKSKFEFIDAEKANYAITKMCQWLGVSRSGFYDWRDRPDSATAERRATLTELVVALFNEFEQRYGYRKIRAELARRGVQVGEWLVRSIMAAEGLVCCHPRPWRSTTDPDGTAGPADLIDGDFTSAAPGDRFVGDITYIRTGSGWLYLATMIDLFNREIVGYDMATHMRAELVTNAIQMAINRGLVNPGAVFHSDRGSQYTSTDMHDFLTEHKMRGSMGRIGVCWDCDDGGSGFPLVVGASRWCRSARPDPCYERLCVLALTCRSGGPVPECLASRAGSDLIGA